MNERNVWREFVKKDGECAIAECEGTFLHVLWRFWVGAVENSRGFSKTFEDYRLALSEKLFPASIRDAVAAGGGGEGVVAGEAVVLLQGFAFDGHASAS
mgnify:CR=1 FL=1